MINEMTFEKAIKNADALKSLNVGEIYLSDDGDIPWHIADDCRPGGSHRLDISTSVETMKCMAENAEDLWIHSVKNEKNI